MLESIKHALEVIERIEEDLEAEGRDELRKSAKKLPAEKSQSVLQDLEMLRGMGIDKSLVGDSFAVEEEEGEEGQTLLKDLRAKFEGEAPSVAFSPSGVVHDKYAVRINELEDQIYKQDQELSELTGENLELKSIMEEMKLRQVEARGKRKG